MKKIVILDDGLSVKHVHRDIAIALGDVFEFKFYNATRFVLDEVMSEISTCDVCMTSHEYHQSIIDILKLRDDNQLNKVVVVCHGYGEVSYESQWSPEITYGVVSDVLLPFVPAGTHVVPNGVNGSRFNWKPCSGDVKTLGWCGRMATEVKRVNWVLEIARGCRTPVSIAETLPLDTLNKWYHSIDILLVAAGPESYVETGPLPPFEAIMSGIPVIGTKVGNFRKVPGPKFSTVEEAVAIISELKSDPERVRNLATEQYDWVRENWTYKTHAAAWKKMFECALEKQTLGLEKLG
jgi:glycosyltransferase involved in cell wall biosynthesis